MLINSQFSTISPNPLFDKRGSKSPLSKGDLEGLNKHLEGLKKIDIDAIHSKRGCIRYKGDLTFMAKQNRRNPTEAEDKIWRDFLSKDKTGFRFLRQKPINRFILDFYCSELNLAIEIDGNSHDRKKETDTMRDNFLDQIGIKTIRFTNDEVLNRPEYIKESLNHLLSKRGSKSPLSKGDLEGLKTIMIEKP